MIQLMNRQPTMTPTDVSGVAACASRMAIGVCPIDLAGRGLAVSA